MNVCLKIGFILAIVTFCIVGSSVSVERVYAATYTWDGGAAGNNWSECANWSSDICPGASDIALFNGTSVKDAVIDSSYTGSVGGLQIASGYTGTIKQDIVTLAVGTSDFNQASGTFIQGTRTLDVDDNFTVSGGVYMAGAGTTSIKNAHVVSGGTYTASTTRVIIMDSSGSTSSFSYPGVFPGTVQIAKSPSARRVTVTSGTTINRWQPDAIQSGALTIAEGASISTGEGALNVSSLTINGTMYASSTLIVEGRFTVSSTGAFYYDESSMTVGSYVHAGTFDVTDVEVTIAGGSVNEPFTYPGVFPGIVQIAKSPEARMVYVTTGTTINRWKDVAIASGGLNIAEGASVSTGASTFQNMYALTINGSLYASSTIDLSSNFYLGASGVFEYEAEELFVGASYTDNGGAFDESDIAVTFDTPTVNGTITAPDPFGAVTISRPSRTVLLATPLVSRGDLTITSGTLDVTATACDGGPCNITVGGDWSNSDAFTSRTGTVTLNGTSQSVSGNTTFYNLTKSVSTADTLSFAAGSRQTILGALTLEGAGGELLSLRSSTGGSQWEIDPQGTRTIEYLDVQDSNNVHATVISTVGFAVTDSGNNTNWAFNTVPSAPASLGSEAYVDGSFGTDVTPTLTFTTADIDGDAVAYTIHIDDSSDFSSPVVEYTGSSGAVGALSFTVGQAAGGGSYAVGSEGQMLTDNAYYWRVRATDSHGGSGSYAVARSGDIAFRIDTTAPVTGSVVLGGTTTNSVTATISGASDEGSGLAASPYLFYESVSESGTSATTSTAWTLGDLSPNTEYVFTVGVVDTLGNAATTTEVRGYTLAEVPASATAVVNSDTQVTFTWAANGNPGTTEYYAENVTLATSSGWSTNTSWTNSGLTPSTAYTYTVKARNGNGLETATTSVTVTTQATPVEDEEETSNTGGGGYYRAPQQILEKVLKADASRSLVIGPQRVYRGEVVQLFIVLRDMFGTAKRRGGETVAVIVNGPNAAFPRVTDNNDGTYTATYVAANAGTDTVVAYVNGAPVGEDSDGSNNGTLVVEARTMPAAVIDSAQVSHEQEGELGENATTLPVQVNDMSELEEGPLAVSSGVTAACHRAFSWNQERQITIYRQIGDGHEVVIATPASNQPWFVDVDPITGVALTYRLTIVGAKEEIIRFTPEALNVCGSVASMTREMDIDNDGHNEQYIDGVYQDTDGSSSALAIVDDGLLIDTNSDGEPDIFWKPGKGTSPVVSAGDRLYIANSHVTEITMYEKYQQGAYRVFLNAVAGGQVALAVEGSTLGAYAEEESIGTAREMRGVMLCMVGLGLLFGVGFFGVRQRIRKKRNAAIYG